MTTFLWTGASNTNWNNSSNWNVVDGTTVTSRTGIPGSADTVLIMSGNTLRQAGYTFNGDTNAINNAVKNMTPTLNGITSITVANVTLGGNGGPATLITGSTPFTVTDTLQDPLTAGLSNSQGGSYSLQGTNIYIGHLNWGTGGSVSYGTNGSPAAVTVDWMRGAGQNANGNYSTITVTKGYDVDSSGAPLFRNGQNGNNNWNFAYAQSATPSSSGNCFLPGSLILTPRGNVPVEDIRRTDSVIVRIGDRSVAREVVWTGKARVIVDTSRPVDRAGYPVRIIRDAFADGRPAQDLLVTSEHCMLLDGRFVPARMLVNGASIFYDTSITSYDHYHIETEEHSIITANDVLTESYLDTGNRRSFRQGGTVVQFGSRALTWENDAAAPLDVSRTFVEPHFRKLEHRAATTLGLSSQKLPCGTTTEPDLHLLTDAGHIIRPTRIKGNKAMFMLPHSVDSIRILSRTSRPCEAIGAFIDDRRDLGVLIGQISLFDSVKSETIDHHLTSRTLIGWEAAHNAHARWTTGNAELPLGKRTPNSIGMLALEILSAGPYVVAQTDQSAMEITQSVLIETQGLFA
ncbi:Hint domain-containing protein [Asaia astilbis]|uniref:Hint domain-containing protein n=1 Tax=Asaia astilbis TaxID=610244 RepID=UPI000470E253|nr:Hint domain-containing protein [Asaia astilbis]